MKIHLFTHFLRYLKPYWGKELTLLILMILSAAGSLVSPYVLKIIIDTVFPTHNYSLLLQILGILFAVNILRLIINCLSDYLFEWVSNHITQDIRTDLFHHLINLPISFFNKNKIGDLVHRISSEVNSIQAILTGTVVRLINSICVIIGLTIMLCILNYKLFLISMLVMPFIFINTRWFQPKIQKMVKKSREKDSDILSFLIERFTNIKLIKSYVRYDMEQHKLSFKIKDQINYSLKIVRLTTTTRNLTLLFTTLVPLLILGMGGRQVMAEAMTIGALVAFIQYMNRIFDPFRNLMSLYFDAIRAAVSMQRIFELLEFRPEEDEGEQKLNFRQEIILRNVIFNYGDLPVLKGVTFSFTYGKKYALVGGSGCGKSTLVALLCRFYDIQSGEICIGNENINSYNIHALRSRITLVTQENQLFNDTISENIRYGRLDSTSFEIIEAARLTGILDYIETLPEGFDTQLGDHGTGLSGGQQQRIAIARSILKEADIIILDEATSALDSESEKQTLDNLCNNLYKNKMVIVISHRLSAIRDMDEIVCLDKGIVVESGTHKQLIAKDGFYKKLFKEQIE